MEIWIPDQINPEKVEEVVSKWLELKNSRPYQHLIQQLVSSTFPQLHQPQTLYIVELVNKKLKIIEPKKEENKFPYKVALCSICHVEDSVVRTTLPCNHTFHVHCILKWFRICQTCPLCRMDCKNIY